MNEVVSVDLGGTKISCALVNQKGRVLKRIAKSTVNGSETAVLDQLKEMIREVILASRTKPRALGLAVPGLVDFERGRALYAINLPWSNTPLRSLLRREFGIEVVIDNDAKAAAIGEYKFGAGKGSRNMFYLNVGTGIGGALVNDGRVYRGITNTAGEVGHMSIRADGEQCLCGNFGCLDIYASGRAIMRNAETILRKQKLNSAMSEEISPELVFEAARAGREWAVRILHDAGESLGIGVVNIMHMVNPDRIVIGGGVIRSWSLLSKPFFEAVSRRAFKLVAQRSRIRLSELGENAGLIGAASIAMDISGQP